MTEIVVQAIHFEDRSGSEFERLAFAYILRVEEWDSIDWYGQLGSDRGRDIWGVLSNRDWPLTVCYQCANHQKLEFRKAKEDIDKICSGPNEIPGRFVLIVGGRVSASLRTRIAAYASSKGINATDIWSGPEFEERLRKDTPSLIRRFSEGIVFPESVSDLSTFILEAKELDDHKLLAVYASCFDRPAFTTPFSQESSLPDFKKAITDTIEALQTGVHRLRDGTVIKRFPSLPEVSNSSIRQGVREILVDLQKLRASYDSLCIAGEIRHCGCSLPDCPIYMLSRRACREMDSARRSILNKFGRLYPGFEVRMWR